MTHDSAPARLRSLDVETPPLALPAAVAFDFDGTLYRTMENHHEAYRRVFAEYGRDVHWREVCLQEGRRAEEVIASLMVAKGLGSDVARARELGKRKGEIFRSLPPPSWYPGALDMLADLTRRGVPLALVTGTTRTNVRHLLGASEKLFQTIVTAEDVARSKPDPEPYAKAFAALGVAPARCVVVENAPLGIASGKAAGARVLAVVSTLEAGDLAGADAVARDLVEVHGLHAGGAFA